MLCAQKKIDRWWINQAVGAGTFKDDDLRQKLVTSTGLYVQQKHVYAGFNFGTRIHVSPKTNDVNSSLIEINGIFGISTTNNNFYANAGSGFSLLYYNVTTLQVTQFSTSYTSKSMLSPGLPAQAEFGLNINHNFSIGIQAMGNLNFIQPFGSLLASVRVVRFQK